MWIISFIRHAESIANAEWTIAGSQNSELSEYWKQAAEAFASYHSSLFNNFRILTNDQKRCRDTAKTIYDQNMSSDLNFRTSLKERDFGEYAGREKKAMIKDLSEKFPLLAKQYGTDFNLRLEKELRYSGVLLFESTQQLKKRILSTLDLETLEKHNTLLVLNTWGVRILLMELLWYTNQWLGSYLENTTGRDSIPHLALNQFSYHSNTSSFKPHAVLSLSKELQEEFRDIKKKLGLTLA